MYTNEPKLPTPASSGTTISLHKKFGGGEKTHQQASAEMREANEVKSKDTAKVVVSIFKCPLRKEAMRQATALDNWIRIQTLPWGDDGRRWVPNSKKDKIDDYIKASIRAIDKLMEQHFEPENWSRLERHWKERAGKLAITGINFPERGVYMEKYSVHVDVGPVVDVERIQPGAMTPELRDRFVKDVHASEQRRVMEGMKDLTNRIAKTLEKVVKIENYTEDKNTEGGETKFYNSRISNTSKLADAIGELNIANDPEIEEIRKKILNEIACRDTNDLKKDGRARMQVVQSAKDLLARAGQFGRKDDN